MRFWRSLKRNGDEEEMGGFRRLSDPNKTVDDAQRVIVKDDSSDSVLSDPTGTESQRQQGPQTIRKKLEDILYSTEFQIVVIVLVIVDCILVIGELILDFSALEDGQCPVGNETKEAILKSKRHIGPQNVHTSNDTQEKINAAMVLHYMSLTILSIFMVELMFKIGVLQKEFFHHKLEIFDAFVIVSSFVLDIISLVYEEAFAALELLVLLRLWRIVRVVNGVIVSVETQAEKKIELQKRLREEVDHELEKFRQYCAVQEKEIEVLREELKRHGIAIDDDLLTEKPRALSNQMDVVVEVNKVNIEKSDSSDSEKTEVKESNKADENIISNASTPPTSPVKEQYFNEVSDC